MSVNKLIFRNLKKNLKNYYLYVFALIFSAALYFSFVTLQYDPSMDPVEGTIKGEAGIFTTSILLVAIVSVFLLYANTIFIKRRSQEIGLFQLIGMTKNRIFRILTAENFLLYFGSLLIGIFVGFAFSKLMIMILFKVTGVKAIAELRFSEQALVQTLIVFAIIYLFIMMMNYLFIKRQTILSLFCARSSTEGKMKKISIMQMIIGILGIGLVLTGYYLSSTMFENDMNYLLFSMVFILASVIIGTYLFFKGSVNFIFHIIRRSKNGYLSINEVLSLSSIMFRMKSNAFLLTVITTVSALAIGLLSLCYISYYSIEKSVLSGIPSDFVFVNKEDADLFKQGLDMEEIEYKEISKEVLSLRFNMDDIATKDLDISDLDKKNVPLPVISDNSTEQIDVAADETVFASDSDIVTILIPLKESGKTELKSTNETLPLQYLGSVKLSPISRWHTSGGLPVAIIDDTVFNRIKNDIDPEFKSFTSIDIGIDIQNEADLKRANKLFTKVEFTSDLPHYSQFHDLNDQKLSMGLVMFVVGFLGLTFLITSGCILYFKQMDESEEEKSNYTVLRKLGFTQQDLVKGIAAKQLFNFGIPLILGLFHSYFAVRSGWFWFGTEMLTPMIIVMIFYTCLYSIFGFLSVLYYKKVIKDAL